MRAGPRVLAITAVAIAIGVCAAFSCKTFDLPNDTCDPSHLHGMLSADLSSAACDRCLEDRCCEEVGICSRTQGCSEVVSNVHACVVGAKLHGAQMETACARDAGLVAKTPADQAYRCMRRCGDECGLPVCKVDRAATLIQTPECDECFSSSCCKELNTCYGNRECKLVIECIANTCGTSLGDSLESAPLSILASIDAGMPDLCDGGGAPACERGGTGIPACVSTCVCMFAAHDQGLPPEDPSLTPDRLALAVYVCGQQAQCGNHCPRSADGSATGACSGAGAGDGDASSDGGAGR